MDVANVKHYLNDTKAKRSALNARKLVVGGREPLGLELRPFKPRAYKDPAPLVEYFNHWPSLTSLNTP